MPRITTINVQPFDSAQGIDADETMTITADFARDVGDAVEADHDCEDSTCDVHAALLAGAPVAAACILVGATDCAHVDAVVCAHKMNGTVDPQWPNLYGVADWPAWIAYHDEHGRECGACGAFTYDDSETCGNCLAALPIDEAQAREIAEFYADHGGEGSGALRYFARTGITHGAGLRTYLSGPIENMPPRLAHPAVRVNRPNTSPRGSTR